MHAFWAEAAALVWGPATVVLLVGTGIYLSFRLKFTHLRKFGLGWRFAGQGVAAPAQNRAEASAPPGEISPWQSMMTMLGGAIGNGNIAGVDVFIITFVTCTLTALVVTITGKWTTGTMSTALVASTFNTNISVVGGWMVAVSSFLFGYPNLVGWSYYGELCFGYIFRSNVLKIYTWIYCGLIFVGAVTEVKTVWDYADAMNGLQIFPNLIALIILAPQVAAATRTYFNPTPSE